MLFKPANTERKINMADRLSCFKWELGIILFIIIRRVIRSIMQLEKTKNGHVRICRRMFMIMCHQLWKPDQLVQFRSTEHKHS